MPIGHIRNVKSRGNGRLLEAAAQFLSEHPEALVIAPTHLAGEDLAHRAIGRGSLGVHRLTMIQLAADLARPEMARLGLAPLTLLGTEALAARVAAGCLKESKISYFAPVSALPGFARALARTLDELRMNRTVHAVLAESGAPGADLAILLARYEREMQASALADRARIFDLAISAARGPHRWLGLPLVWLDVPLRSASEREFFDAVAGRAPAVIRCEIAEEAGDPPPASELEHLRAYLFESSPPAGPRSGALDVFSAPGEGLEAVEIARRIARLARGGRRLDEVAILLRDPQRYQPMIEEALRRASIPAYFSRGTPRPDAGGRAFLALLACALEKCSASRFAEYLSLGQMPAADAEPFSGWIGADDEMLPADDGAIEAGPETDESKVARLALRRPEPVVALLAEFEPMGEIGPAPLEEVTEVLSERLRFLRREPPRRPYGRVFVGSIEEARGCEFPFVFLPGLAEGIFPRRALEDPLLLDEFRRAID